MTQARPGRTRYRTTNWKTYNAALKARGSLTMWLDQDMQWLATPTGRRGRQKTFSDAAIQFCLSIKVLFRLPLRQTLGLVESLLRLAALDWPVPDYSTVCRRQKTLQVQIGYRPSAQSLQLLVDSTGIQFLGEGEWKRRKHSAEYRRDWRNKVHLGAEFRNETVRACSRLGRRLWKAWSGYHRLSLVETKMHCFKRLGEPVTARTFERQVVELHARVALLNRFGQIGRAQTVSVAAVA